MISYLIEANIVLLILFGMFEVIARSAKWLEVNRIVYLLIPVIAGLIPFLELNYAASANLAAINTFNLETVQVYTSTQTIGNGLTWSQIGLLFATLILLIGVFIFAYQFIKIKRQEYIDFQGFKLNEEGCESYSFFKFIVLKKGLSIHEKEVILYHEMYHGLKYHSFDVLLIQLLQGIFIINPAYYALRKAVRINHEFLADKASAEKFGTHSYATCIVSQAIGTNVSIIHNTFSSTNKSASFKRLNMLNLKNQRKMKKLIYLLMLPLVAGTGAIASVNYLPESVENLKPIVKGDGEIDVAQYPGGQEEMVKFIGDKTVYPEEAKKNDFQGTVMVALDIAATGKVTNVSVKRSSGHEVLDKEAVRVVGLMPDWIPATKNGENVQSEYILPIAFKL